MGSDGGATIFSILRRGDGDSNTTRGLAIAAGLLVLTWAGVNAIWSLTSDETTLVSETLERVLPLGGWVGAVFATLVVFGIVWGLRGERIRFGFVSILLAYMVGLLASRYAYVAVDPRGGVPFDEFTDIFFSLWERSFYLMPAIPMLLVRVLVRKTGDEHFFRFGNWRTRTHVFVGAGSGSTWTKQFLAWMVFAVLPLAVMMQSSVEFAPIRTGNLFVFLIPVITMAFFNAFAEELIFRGLFLSALARFVGPGFAIWMQGIYFGFHHWGSSPDLISGLPTAIVTSLLGVIWGKSVLETRGLGWAVCCHAAVDFAFFSAHFVAV